MPLYWTADWAHALRQWWRLNLRAAVAYFGPTMLNIELGASINRSTPFTYPVGLPVVDVNYTTNGGPQTESFGAVLVTVGFRVEDAKVGSSPTAFASLS
jgi:hypothetical protein